MIISKKELSQKIESIKSIVPKKSPVEAIQSILLKEGYLIATNHEITIKAKLEGAEGEQFLIPQMAFDLIKSMPDGDMEISADEKNVVTIKSGNINNRFQSLSPELFNTRNEADNDDGYDMDVDSAELKECIKNVLYAVSKRDHGQKKGALCINGTEGYLNFAGMDGYVLAWDKLKFHGDVMELLIPRTAAEKLLQLDFNGAVQIKHSPTSAVFTTEEYIIETRLIAGEYFAYANVFKDMPIHTTVNRKKFMDAVNRAAMCIEADNRIPLRLQFSSDNVEVFLKAKTAEYSEMVALEKPAEKPVLIAFDSRLLMETLKAFDTELVHINLDSERQPLLMNADEKELQSIILPVCI